MKRVYDLRPAPAKPYPQCEARRAEKYCSDVAGVPNQCKRSATVKIDGKNMCRPHAGQMALKILMVDKTNIGD